MQKKELKIKKTSSMKNNKTIQELKQRGLIHLTNQWIILLPWVN